MKKLILLILILLASYALAQNYDKDMDLPVEAPVFGQKQAEKQPPKPPEAPPIENPPPVIYGKEIRSQSGTIEYVLDISGSMTEEYGTYLTLDNQVLFGPRIARAKASLARSIYSLPKSFKFNVFAYYCVVIQWKGGLTDASDAEKQSAIAWINALEPQGGTGTGPAVSWALNSDKTNKLMVLLTDGRPNCGAGSGYDDDPSCIEAHLSQIKWANTQKASINVFGISATGKFRAFCIDVACQNNGSYTDVK